MESGCHYLNACAITLKLTLKTDNWSRIGFKCIYIHEMKKSSLIRLDLSRFLSHKSTGQSGEGVGAGVGKQQCDTASLPPNYNIPCTAGEPPSHVKQELLYMEKGPKSRILTHNQLVHLQQTC